MKSRGEYVPALILVVLGAVFAISSFHYGIIGEGARVGPGFLPCVVGILLVVFGAMIAWETWHARAAHAASQSPADAGADPASGDGEIVLGEGKGGTVGSVALVLGMLAVAVFLTPYLGFLLTFSLMVFAILAVVEREKVWFSLAIAVGLGVLAWLVFEAFMGIGLPAGILYLLRG